jgi:hypothetical protein
MCQIRQQTLFYSSATFLTLQDKHNIRTLSLNIKFICTRSKQAWKARQRLAILPVSKARTNKFYIYRQCSWKVYSSSTNKAKIYSYSIFVQQMYWLQDNYVYCHFQQFFGYIVTTILNGVQNVCQSSWNNLRKFIFSFDHMTSGF